MSYILFTIYSLILISITFIISKYYKSNKKIDMQSYYGKREFGYFVSALSCEMSGVTAWILLSVPGLFYAFKIQYIFMMIFILINGVFEWFFIAYQVNLKTSLYNIYTLPSYISKVYDDKRGMLNIISFIIILISYLLSSTSCLMVVGRVLVTFTGLPYWLIVCTTAIITFLYSFEGGYKIICITDVIQGLVLIFVIILVPIYTVYVLGYSNIYNYISANKVLYINSIYNNMNIYSILTYIFWGWGAFSQPQVFSRYVTVKNTYNLKIATRIAVLFRTLMFIGSISIGILGYIYFDIYNIKIIDNELIMIKLSQLIFNPIMQGVIVIAILSAVMSSIDSYLISLSSIFMYDIISIYKNNKTIDNSYYILLISKIPMLATIFLSICLSFIMKDSTIHRISGYSWAVTASVFSPLIIGGFIFNKPYKYSAYISIVVSIIFLLIWSFNDRGIFDIYELIPGALSGIIALCISNIMYSKLKQC